MIIIGPIPVDLIFPVLTDYHLQLIETKDLSLANPTYFNLRAT